MISPEVREDAHRFQEQLIQKLIDVLCDNNEFEIDRWPFDRAQMAVITASAYAHALRIMLQTIRENIPSREAAEREIDFLLRYCKEAIDP